MARAIQIAVNVIAFLTAPVLPYVVGYASGQMVLMGRVAGVALAIAILVVTLPGVRDFVRQALNDIEDDLWLLLSRPEVESRVKKWRRQVAIYSALKVGDPQSADISSRQVDYLSSNRLGILDRKFSTLLQVQSLLGIMVSVATGAALWNALKLAVHTWHGGPLLFYATSLLWVVTIVGCLGAIGNPVWGDLWRLPNDRGKSPVT